MVVKINKMKTVHGVTDESAHGGTNDREKNTGNGSVLDYSWETLRLKRCDAICPYIQADYSRRSHRVCKLRVIEYECPRISYQGQRTSHNRQYNRQVYIETRLIAYRVNNTNARLYQWLNTRTIKARQRTICNCRAFWHSTLRIHNSENIFNVEMIIQQTGCPDSDGSIAL